MHDRHLASKGHQQRTSWESYHWAMASSLFRRRLADGFALADGDATWMTATSLSWISLCAIETSDAEEVWPLKPASASDLDWLDMQNGMRAIWDMLSGGTSTRFMKRQRLIDSKERCIGIPRPKPGISGLPLPLVLLCELDEWSGSDNNPYHAAVWILSELLQEADDYTSMLRFLAFPNTFEHKFGAMLKARDPRALLLMAIWYELVPPSFWWISLRVSLERTAIWRYLARYHAVDCYIHSFVTAFSPADLCPGRETRESKWQNNLVSRFNDLTLASG